MAFHVYLNGASRGPFSEEQMRAFLDGGLLQPSDLASDRVDADWKPLVSFEPFRDSPSVSALPLASQPPAPMANHEPAKVALGLYARSTLAPNETAVFKTSLHWIVFVRFAGLTLAAFLFLAMPFAIGVQALLGSEKGWFALPLPAFIMIAPTLAWISSELVVTDRRVLIKTGIVRRNTMEIFITKVESIAIDQGFVGRLLDYGTVIIRGTGGFEEPFETIAHPIEFRNWVQRVQHRDERPPLA